MKLTIYYGKLTSKNRFLSSMALILLQRIQIEVTSISLQNMWPFGTWVTIVFFLNLRSTPNLFKVKLIWLPMILQATENKYYLLGLSFTIKPLMV